MARLALLLPLLVILSLSYVTAQDPRCAVYTGPTGIEYWMYSYALTDHHATSGAYTFYWNLCNNVSYSLCQEKTAVCQVKAQDGSVYYDGLQPPTISEGAVLSDGTPVFGLTYTYTNPNRLCTPTVSPRTRISFVCDYAIDEWQTYYVGEVALCDYLIVVRTQLGCGDQPTTTPGPGPTPPPTAHPTPAPSPTFTPPTSCEIFTLDGVSYDFSSYANEEHSGYASNGYNYYWSLCDNVTYFLCASLDAAVCLQSREAGSPTNNGNQPPVITAGAQLYGGGVDNGVTYTYYYPQKVCSSGDVLRTRLSFRCNPNVLDWRTWFITDVSECDHLIITDTSLACGNTPTTTPSPITTTTYSPTTSTTTSPTPTSGPCPAQRTCCLYSNSSGYKTICTIDHKCSKIKGLKSAGSYHVLGCDECSRPQSVVEGVFAVEEEGAFMEEAEEQEESE